MTHTDIQRMNRKCTKEVLILLYLIAFDDAAENSSFGGRRNA